MDIRPVSYTHLEQYFLEEAGRSKEAEQLNDLLDRLEDQYADEEIDENSDDVVIDHDLEDITDDSDVLEKLGIDPDEAQYAPDPEQEYGDEDDEAEDGDAESDAVSYTHLDVYKRQVVLLDECARTYLCPTIGHGITRWILEYRRVIVIHNRGLH